MFKKLIGLITSMSILASGFVVTQVCAGSNFNIHYSTDGVNWTTLTKDDFLDDTSSLQNDSANFRVHFFAEFSTGEENNIIDIYDKAQYIYLYSDDEATWSSLMKNNGAAKNWWSDGTTDQLAMHVVLPVTLEGGDSRDNPIVIPFRASWADTIAEINGERYFMQFRGRYAESAQNPNVGATHGIFTTTDKKGNVGKIWNLYGASVNNDNQMLLCSYTKYNDASGTQKEWPKDRMWVGANMSKYLCGSSYVCMPGVGLSQQYGDTTANSVSTKYFDISVNENYKYLDESGINGAMYTDNEGNAGEVVVLMFQPAAEDSVYLNELSGWECVNNGTSPDEMEFSYDNEYEMSSILTDRDYNDYDTDNNPELNYYGVAIKYIVSTFKAANTGTDGINKNVQRLKSMHGRISQGKEFGDAVELKYAYRKKFKPGEAVGIHSPGNIVVDPSDNQERQGLMVPIIKYYTPENKVDEIEAYHNADENNVYVHVNTTNNYINNLRYNTVVYVLFNSYHDILDLKVVGSGNTSDEFVFEDVKNPAGVELKAYYIVGEGDPDYKDESIVVKDYGEIFYAVEGDSLNKVK